MKLSASVVKSATPKNHEYVVWDSELSGFGLRVQTTGSQSFIVKYRVGRGRSAKQRKLSLGAPGNPFTAHEARIEAARIISEAKLGGDPVADLKSRASEGLTVGGFLDTWEKEAAHLDRRTGRRRKEASVAGDIRRLNIHVRPLLGALVLKELNPDDLRKFRQDVANGKTARSKKTKLRGVSKATGGDGTAIATLRIFKSALGYAVEKGLIDQNPVAKLRLPASGQKDRFLSADELKRLGRALDEYEAEGGNTNASDLIRMLCLTGARRGEMEALKWKQVDFERGVVLLEDTKTGRAAWPLSIAALELLSSLKTDEHSEWVFPATSGGGYFRGLNKAWPKVREKAGLSDVRLHDLRHSFASVGAASGLGLQVVGKLLGHKQASTTSRYSHLADDPLRKAANEIGAKISKSMGEVS